MGNMYKGKCYEYPSDVAEVIASELIWKGQYPIEFVNEAPFGNDIFIQFNVDGVSDDEVLVSPSCTYTGLENFMGVDIVDAVEASWLVALTLIAAWSVVVIKRTF